LLADALGGRAYPASKFSVGFPSYSLTSEGRKDPVMSKFIEPSLVHHGDTWDVPTGGTLLATASTGFPMAFRLGSAFGVQFHPEASPTELKAWAARSPARYQSIGAVADRVIAEATDKFAAWRASAHQLFEAWWLSLPAACRA